ncbi:sulfite oxidase [Microvirga sp. BT689]|uniref:sulfite oxidase n=1 Tax=Microvirga arvi TaxID=2778731 RepID=UPI00194FECB6|nr:sulfite oxidase [Microvirga arvi]MBM6583545.1 sulfite oxidase [Microvirga arvi]
MGTDDADLAKGNSAPSPEGEAPALSRRSFVALSAMAATLIDQAHADVPPSFPNAQGNCSTVPATPTAERPAPQENWLDFSPAEVTLAFRNHGMQAEFLREPITPLGTHYLLIHFDVPQLSADNYSIAIGGRVRNPRRISLTELKSRPVVSQTVTMECAGTGRYPMKPRAVYVPWASEAIGTYRWTGTPLRPLLEQAGLLDDAVEVLFTGWDTGIDLGVEHAFERSLPVAEALRDEVMLAWDANGQPLLPQHGYPLRLIVPSWYGMASVKWLRAISVLNEPFQGVEQAQVYRYQQQKDEPGEPVRHKRVNSSMMPPGIPDLLTRHRFLAPGRHVLQGTAWSGMGRITKVEVSTDDGGSWREAELVPVSSDPYAWIHWRAVWENATPGEHILVCRASDDAGNVQPLMPNDAWNRQGMGGNVVERIPVRVQEGIGAAGVRVPSQARVAVDGAKAPSVPKIDNPLAP